MTLNRLILFSFILVLFSSSIFATSITNINTKIIIRENGTLEISDVLNVKDINSDFLVLNNIPVYDIHITINGANAEFNSTIDKLNINLTSINTTDNATINIVYLTDYYSTKNKDDWEVNYTPAFINQVDSLQVVLPRESEIISLSTDLNSLVVSKKQFMINVKDINALEINYKLGNQKLITKNSSMFIILGIILILLIGGGAYLFFRKKKTKNVLKKEDDKSKLLLGLNENEQKIIKVLLEEDGQSQGKVSLKLYLPKGTVSRNIQKLQDKGYVDIKKYGSTNKVFLSNLFKDKDSTKK